MYLHRCSTLWGNPRHSSKLYWLENKPQIFFRSIWIRDSARKTNVTDSTPSNWWLRSGHNSRQHFKLTRNASASENTKLDQPSKGNTVKQGTNEAREPWKIQKDALSKKFGNGGWTPRKRLSPDALDGIRDLNAQDPKTYTTEALADQFKVSPEAIRRILKSKWAPTDEQRNNRRGRWERRGQYIWSQMAELGIKPPRKWRARHGPFQTKQVSKTSLPSPTARSGATQRSLSDRIL